MRPSALLRRLWRAQLRLRVMAGVVIVMLVAIAAFDIGAVATMRRYLLGQTDKNLQVTLAMTRIQLPSLVPGYPPRPAVQATVAQAPGGGGANVTWTGASSRPVRSLLGEFSITFFPRGGKPVQLEVGANGPAASSWPCRRTSPGWSRSRVRGPCSASTGGSRSGSTTSRSSAASLSRVPA
jgi:hypothetical protein